MPKTTNRPAIAHAYQEKSGQWRWRLIAGNGKIVADSAESYTKRDDATDALVLIRALLIRPVRWVIDEPRPVTKPRKGAKSRKAHA